VTRDPTTPGYRTELADIIDIHLGEG
jgi:hypothetical protein